MRNQAVKALVIFLVAFSVLAVAGKVFAQGWFKTSSGPSGERITLINVEGAISGSAAAASPFGESGASSVYIAEQLHQAARSNDIKGVLLRVNSPGGSAAASDEIYQGVMAVRNAGKPVVVSMGDVAASGGYYISAAADKIYANGATLTGSIGVIFSLMNWEELADKWGVDDVTLHAGEYKDIGSPWRQMTDKEKEMMQELLDDVHEEFMQAVIAGRSNAPNPMTEEQVRAAATGMIYTGTKAKELGLVDEIGGLEEAKAEVRRMANVGQDFPVEPEAAPSLLEELLGVSMQGQAPNPLARFVADPLSLMAGRLYMNTTLRDIVLR
ncbi:signal peptide peptidase SppA [bacterium]|nr:signal peptide peptidase SppA [bacterium]